MKISRSHKVPFIADAGMNPACVDTPAGRVSIGYSEQLGAVLLSIRDQHGTLGVLDVELTRITVSGDEGNIARIRVVDRARACND